MNSLERWLVEFIVQISGDRAQISIRDVKRAARRKIEGIPDHLVEQRIRDAFYPMEQWGWLTEISTDSRRSQWAVNPAVALDYADRRRDVLAAKQRRTDAMATNIGLPRRILT